MRNPLYLTMLLPCFLLLACQDGGDRDTGAGPAPASQSAPAQRAGASALKGLDSACAIFSDDEIRGFFDIAEGTELKVSRSGQAFPACNYEWGKDLVVRQIQAGGRDIEVRDPAKVMLVVAPDVTADNFQTSTAVYRQPQDVSGIGDMARWDEGMSQLSFLAGADLFHINVKASSDPAENRRLAEALALQVLEKF